MSIERDYKAEKKDLEEAFDIIADKLVKAESQIELLKKKIQDLSQKPLKEKIIK
jgi:prefoldin subunit 5